MTTATKNPAKVLKALDREARRQVVCGLLSHPDHFWGSSESDAATDARIHGANLVVLCRRGVWTAEGVAYRAMLAN